MSARSRMTMRATIERKAAGTDPWGAPSGDWEVHLASLPCWAYNRVSREAVSEDRTAVIDDIRLLVPAGTDITETDRITAVKDRRGNSIFSDALNIRGVSPQQGHVEVVAESAGG